MKKIISAILIILIAGSCLCIPGVEAGAASSDTGSAVSVDNVKSMPSTVKVASFNDFKRKLATAINLKKSSINIEVVKYNKNEYTSVNIDKHFSDIAFQISLPKGYTTSYQASWTTSGNSAKYSYRFTYRDISSDFQISKLKKAGNPTELTKIIKEAALGKTSVISVVLGNSNTQKYDIEKSVLQANDKDIKAKGFYVKYRSFDGISSSGNNIVNIYLEYFDIKTNLPSGILITSYKDFYNKVYGLLADKQWKFVFDIKDYNTEEYNLGEVLLKINKELSQKKGYCARVTGRSVVGETPASMVVYLDYVNVKPGEYITEEDRKNPIYNNEKEWYQAIKHAVSNCMDSMSYNITYSSDFGNLISLVLDQNPDINYVKKFTASSSGKISFAYKFSKGDMIAIKDKVNKKAEAVISDIIKPEMTETQKAMAIHDYLIQNATYDYENYQNKTVPEVGYTAYGILINRIGVCQGYSAAFKLMANMAGIKCIGVTGDAGGPHAWNMALLDGRLGYIDVTWDDPVPDRGVTYYNYFNISEEQMSADHVWDKNMFLEKYFEY